MQSPPECLREPVTIPVFRVNAFLFGWFFARRLLDVSTADPEARDVKNWRREGCDIIVEDGRADDGE